MCLRARALAPSHPRSTATNSLPPRSVKQAPACSSSHLRPVPSPPTLSAQTAFTLPPIYTLLKHLGEPNHHSAQTPRPAAPNMTSESRPESIAGGCLCGSVRYTIHFPADAEWPPSHNATCQCTQCRKATGALLAQLLELPARQLTPSLLAEDRAALPTYRLYASSAQARRGFCCACGSALTWMTDAVPGRIEVHVGTLDEGVLVGEVVEGEREQGDGFGERKTRVGGWGRELAVAGWHHDVENAVPGVTDGMEGVKYLTVGSKGDMGFEGTLKDIGRA